MKLTSTLPLTLLLISLVSGQSQPATILQRDFIDSQLVQAAQAQIAKLEDRIRANERQARALSAQADQDRGSLTQYRLIISNSGKAAK